MKAKTKKSDIARAIKLCVNACNVKDPLRNNIQFMAGDDSLSLDASNATYSVHATCPAVVDEEGVAFVDGKMSADVINKSVGDILFSTDAHSMIIKSCGRTKLPLIEKDFLGIENAKGANVICDAGAFKSAIGRIKYAIAEDQSRVILTGAHIVTDGKKMTITALDGFRLAQTEIECTGDSVDVVVPAPVLSAVCEAITEGTLSFFSDKGKLSFHSDGFIINAMALSGTYMDTTRLIPQVFKTQVLINRKDLFDMANTAVIASGAGNLIKVDIEDGKIILKSNSEQADFSGEVSADVQGEAFEVAFNLRYLLQAISMIPTEQIEINLVNNVSPAILVPHEAMNELHLILPVRVFQ